MPIRNAASGEIVRRNFYIHAVARNDADVVLSNTSAQCTEDIQAVIQLYHEAVAAKCFRHTAICSDEVLLAHYFNFLLNITTVSKILLFPKPAGFHSPSALLHDMIIELKFAVNTTDCQCTYLFGSSFLLRCERLCDRYVCQPLIKQAQDKRPPFRYPYAPVANALYFFTTSA